jgi:hypothetical protein
MAWEREEEGAIADTLRVNTTLTSLDLRSNELREGGGRVIAETLRVNTTLKELNLASNRLGEGGGRITLVLIPATHAARRGTARQHDADVAGAWLA